MTGSLRIEGALVLADAATADRPMRADILVRDSAIAAIGEGLANPAHPARAGLPPPERIIDGRRRLAVPGLVNAHYHSHDVLLKGMFEPLPLDHWNLLALSPSYSRGPREKPRVRTLLGAIECLRGGITTVQDMNRLHPFDEDDLDLVLDCYREVGIRCVLAAHFLGLPPTEALPFLAEEVPPDELWRPCGGVSLVPRGTDALDRIEAAIRARQGRDPLVTFAPGPSPAERVRHATVGRIAEATSRRGLQVFTHLCESRATVMHARRAASGGSLVEMLPQAGLLGPQLGIAHRVWLPAEEIARITGVDEAALAEEAAALLPRLHADATAVRERLAPVFPRVRAANHLAWAETVPLWR